MRKLAPFLKPYKVAIMIALIFTLLELAVELVQPLLMAKIIDEGILVKDLSVVLKWGGVMLLFSAIAFLAGIINSFYSAHVGQNFGFDVRSKLFAKVQSFSFANFNLFPASSLITRMTNDITQIQNTVFMSLRIALRAPLLIIGGLVMAFIVNVKMALILAVVVPFLFLFLFWLLNKGGKLFKIVQEKLDGVNNILRENLTGIRLIKAFVRRKHEEKRFGKVNEYLRDKTIHALRIMELTMPILLLIMNISILAILWFGSIHVGTGQVKIGEVVAIVNYAMRMTAAFSVFSMIIMVFSRARASSNRIVEVLDTKIELIDAEDANEKNKIHEGKIVFDHVSFQYPGSDSPALTNISFTVMPGETIAILGATGSGKTTLLQLIPRLYDIENGSILIDGTDIRKMKMETLRRNIGYVPQEALLFSGSIKDNIYWGKEEATIEEIVAALKNAQIEETINSFPRGLDTNLGQKGVNLSGGQKQRLSIARALVRKPKLLLLDDSTSALDVKTEANLLKALKEYACTTLIITQKLSTAVKADQILLFEDGALLAQGTHEELLRTSALYKKIYRSQSGDGERFYA
ncbi:ABC transporter ATP-binding protein [Bacillus sp. Bva_UNVM-123]|uniref:ABC transporter ATP-binding protein n=1 Tax=Bacillus sp. Bva_UNVM-123 TaxID=2829798 RepID=UPI00391EF79C